MFCIDALWGSVPARQLAPRFHTLGSTAPVSRGTAHGAENYGWTAMLNILCLIWLIRNNTAPSHPDAHITPRHALPFQRCVTRKRHYNDVSASTASQELSGHRPLLNSSDAARTRCGAHRTRGLSHVGLRNQQREEYGHQRSRWCRHATSSSCTPTPNWGQNAGAPTSR